MKNDHVVQIFRRKIHRYTDLSELIIIFSPLNKGNQAKNTNIWQGLGSLFPSHNSVLRDSHY
jgi:hypothetical protein